MFHYYFVSSDTIQTGNKIIVDCEEAIFKTMTTPTASTKRNKGKKHISKHVLKARESKDEAKKEANDEKGNRRAIAKKSIKADRTVKDPSEAINYLKQWKDDKSNWKFNKNTQSWIIRHMYDAEKLDKSAFSLVTEYLQGIQGGTAKSWAVTDATCKALRYKDFDKSQNDVGKDTKGTDKKDSSLSTDAEDEDLIRWKKLSDHDKRKEYKRARKVLEVLKE